MVEGREKVSKGKPFNNMEEGGIHWGLCSVPYTNRGRSTAQSRAAAPNYGGEVAERPI